MRTKSQGLLRRCKKTQSESKPKVLGRGWHEQVRVGDNPSSEGFPPETERFNQPNHRKKSERLKNKIGNFKKNEQKQAK
jgi:hypothetical protein